MVKKKTMSEMIKDIDQQLDDLRNKLIESESHSLWRDCSIVLAITVCILVAYYLLPF